jgi:probable HAF family extracellular repeat protein
MPIYEYGFLYSGGAFATIGTPGSVSVNILGINNLNEILGEGGPCGCTFIYQGGVFTPVVGLPGRASGFNDSGQIVGFYDDAQGYSHGYLYAGGSYTTVDAQGPPVSNGTILWGINNADQIVGTADGLQPINLLNGFLYSGGKTTPILSPNGLQFLPTGLNNLGQIVGRVETGVLFSPALLTPEPASTAINWSAVVDRPSRTTTTALGSAHSCVQARA